MTAGAGGPPAREPATGPGAEAAAAAFGLGDAAGPMTFAARGEMGRIWRLRTTRGGYAVKELLAPVEESEAADDLVLQRAALGAGVRLPEPITTPDGRVLARLDDGTLLRAYTWVDLAPGPVPAPAAAAAAVLARVHGAAPPDPRPVDPWFRDPVPDDRWPALAAAAAASGLAWAEQFERLAQALAATAEVIAAGRHGTTLRCHLDFNPQNVLLAADGGTVVVDWENSGPADPRQELGMALAEFAPDPAGVPAFLAAYRGAGGVVERLEAPDFAMALSVQAHLLEHYATTACDPAADDESRARASYWAADIIEHCWTVPDVERWVAAARS